MNTNTNTNAAESLDPQTAALDALLADLDLMGEDTDLVPDEVLIEDDAHLEAAVNAAEAQEMVDEHYMNSSTEGADELSLESTPVAETKGLDPASLFVETPPTDEVKAEEPPAKKEKGKKKKAESPEGEPKKKVERKHYTSRLERMKDQHGEKLGEFFVLELADAELEGEALAAKQKEFEAVLAGLNKKRQARANLLIDYVAGRTASLNNVIATCFRVLAADGKIVTGDKGNLHQTLLAHPYSAAAARAMGNNSVAVLEAFKVIKKGEAGFVPNIESLMLLKVNAMLGIAG